MSDFSVFVSSTFADLREHREKVIDQLLRMNQQVLAMEYLGSRTVDASEVCAEEVRNCTLFIGIYGFRYGFTVHAGANSITEQEYQLARSEGKRCLCYFADDSTASDFRREDGWTDEPDWKTGKLAEFKRGIDRDLVRSTFDSADDLARKVAADLNRLLLGELFCWTLEDVCKRWHASQLNAYHDLHQRRLDKRPLDVEQSPLLTYWREFALRTAWHDQRKEEVSDICRKAARFHELTHLVERAKGIDFRQKYRTLAASLEDHFSDDEVAEVARLRSLRQAAERGTKEPSNELLSLKAIEREIQTLRLEVANPNFCRCFLVIGGIGSGKTHFIASLLSRHWNDAGVADGSSPGKAVTLILPLDPFKGGELGERILDKIREMTKQDWRRLYEFNSFLEKSGQMTRLMITIDDLQKWFWLRGPAFGDELEQFIEGTSDLHAFDWVLTLQDTRYDLLCHQDQFWVQHASHRHRGRAEPPSLAGWIVLDDLNRDRSVGQNILKIALTRESASESRSLRILDEENQSRRHLSSPFVAWILFDLRDKIDLTHAVNLNFIEFVDDFWTKRISAIERGNFTVADLDLTIGLLSRFLAGSNDFAPSYTHVLDAVVEQAKGESELQEREVAKQAINALVHANLLKINEVRDSKYDDPSKRMEFLPEVFWEYHLARGFFVRELRRQLLPEECKKLLVAWFPSVDSARAGGIYEFLLLITDQAAASSDVDREVATTVWSSGIQPSGLPMDSVWFALPKASEEAQRTVLSDESVQVAGERRATFAFMYAMAEASPQVIDRPARFRRLQPLFKPIDAGTLNSYYLYVAEHHMRRVAKKDELLDCMQYLSGVEHIGLAEELAWITVETMRRNASHDPDVITEIMIEYLKRERERAREEYQLVEGRGEWKRTFFREWVIFKFCHALVARETTESYAILEEHHWFRPKHRHGIDYPLSLEMEREANIALGHFYRTKAEAEERRWFEELVTDLAASRNAKDKQIAFHLIRHTEPVAGPEAVRVNSVFHPILRTLYSEPRLARTALRFRKFFQANQ